MDTQDIIDDLKLTIEGKDTEIQKLRLEIGRLEDSMEEVFQIARYYQ